jgi:hypothetical protein
MIHSVAGVYGHPVRLLLTTCVCGADLEIIPCQAVYHKHKKPYVQQQIDVLYTQLLLPLFSLREGER